MKFSDLKFVSSLLVTAILVSACGGAGDEDDNNTVNIACGAAEEIGPSSMVSGALQSDDCRLVDLAPSSNDPAYVDRYLLKLDVPGNVTIRMLSDTIDSVLFIMKEGVLCRNGDCDESDVLSSDDDSGGGTNGEDARISIILAAGDYLIVAKSFSTETGDYTIETTVTNVSYSIGDTGPAGGIVFYMAPDGLHGLEAAPADQKPPSSMRGVTWGCRGLTINGADGTAIGTGAQNTADILAACSDLGIAARLADNYTLNSFNDWYLPSKEELNELYLQRAVVGNFTSSGNGYWSSTEMFDVGAWFQDFDDGSVHILDRNGTTGVRAIRTF